MQLMAQSKPQHCPKCGTVMESKGPLGPVLAEVDPATLLQCPKCKNVEVLVG